MSLEDGSITIVLQVEAKVHLKSLPGPHFTNTFRSHSKHITPHRKIPIKSPPENTPFPSNKSSRLPDVKSSRLNMGSLAYIGLTSPSHLRPFRECLGTYHIKCFSTSHIIMSVMNREGKGKPFLATFHAKINSESSE